MRRLGYKSQNKPSEEEYDNSFEEDDEDDEFDLEKGFKSNKDSPSPIKSKKVNTAKNISFDDYDDEDDYEEEEEDTDIRKSSRSSTNSNKHKSDAGEGAKRANKLILILIVIFIALVCFVFYKLTSDTNKATKNNASLNPNAVQVTNPETSTVSKETNIANANTSSSNTSTNVNGGTLVKEDENGNPVEIVDDNKNNNESTDVNVGVPNYNINSNMKADTEVENYNNFVKSVDGKDVATNYTVARIDTVTDFVTYTKHRGVTGTGVELYWLDAVYKDRPYVIQVPFKVFKELGDTGITPVKVEVLYLTDNSQIVSYMEVDTTYKSK